MTFDEWWIEFRGFDDQYGKEGMRDCWNAAIEQCAKAIEAGAESLNDLDTDKDCALGFAEILRSMKDAL